MKKIVYYTFVVSIRNKKSSKGMFKMANSPKKSSAEAYRERRKKQISHASKKAKKSAASEKIVKIVVTTICLLLAFVLIVFSAGNIAVNLLGIPQRLIPVATVNGYKVSAAEYNYYYSYLMNLQISTTQQIENQYASAYGEGVGKSYTGYDPDKSPSAQTYAGGEEDEALADDATWSDYFSLNAPRSAYISHTLYEKAVEKGYTLNEDEQKTIDDRIDELRDTAYKNNFSLKRYLTLSVGEGLSESLYRDLLARDSVVARYSEDLQKEYGDKITDKEISAYYAKNTESYDSVNFRYFTFTYTTTADKDESTYTKAQAKKLAYDMLDDIKSYASFSKTAYQYAKTADKATYKEDTATLAKNVTYTTLAQNGKELAKWLFADGRKVNDKTVVLNEAGSTYYVLCLGKVSSLDKTVPPTVRHILVKFDTTDEQGKTIELTNEIKATAKASAETIYTEWKNGDKTEDTFAALAKEKSEDTGSATNGGLIEQVVIGQMVPSFEKWSCDPARKTGDTGIIESTYGYHLMYYVGKSKEAYWKTSIRSTLGGEDYNDYMETLAEEAKGDNAKIHTRFMNYFSGRFMKNIDNLYSNTSSAS